MLYSLAGFSQQLNMPQYDNKAIHFGFNVATNIAQFQVNRSTYFYQIDTLKNVSVQNYPGVGLGGIVSFRLGKYFDLRAIVPQITFSQRDLIYEFDGYTKRNVKVEVESASISGSVLLKYKSGRQYKAIFESLLSEESKTDRKIKESQTQNNMKITFSHNNGKRYAYFLFGSREDYDASLLPGNELRISYKN